MWWNPFERWLPIGQARVTLPDRPAPRPPRGSGCPPRSGAWETPADIIDCVNQLQAVFPFAEIRIGTRGLTVQAYGAMGFPVSIEQLGEDVIVCFGPGLMEFEEIGPALSYAMLACSEQARLRVVRNGNKTRRWRLEVKSSHGQWQRIFAGGFSLLGGTHAGLVDEDVILCNARALPRRTAPAFDLLPGAVEPMLV